MRRTAEEDEEEGGWWIVKTDELMQGTWAGSGEMLDRVIRYVLADDQATIPVSVGAAWSAAKNAGSVEGDVTGMEAVDTTGDGRPELFIAGQAGDRLYRFDPDKGAFEAMTGDAAPTTRSLCWAWGDIDGNGTLDLASWNGEGLQALYQKDNGAFQCTDLAAATALPGTCGGVAVVQTADKARAVVALTDKGVVLVTPSGTLAPAAEGVANAEGPVRGSLYADFDNDDRPDLLVVQGTRGWVLRGTGGGAFAAATDSGIAVDGDGPVVLATGDFDMDGTLDVVTMAGERREMWHNRGAAQFHAMGATAGEFAYISRPGGVAAAVGDVDRDGRQDLLTLYKAEPTRIFFNRGFFCLGHAVELTTDQVLPAAGGGQQGGCWADFNGDGLLEVCLALNDGTLELLSLEGAGEASPAAVVALDAKQVNPVRATAWREETCLGAVNVQPGRPALFGLREPAPVKVTWRLPGGEAAEREVFLEDAPARIAIPGHEEDSH